ncbi:MAG: hypothetical protein ACRDRT_05180 [Pseudonocardiaceae bacterium]
MTESTWTFRVGDLLPSSDPVSRFVTVVAAALNDLLLVNRLLLEPDGATSDGERQYLLRTAIAHLWELSSTLSQWSDEPAVELLLAALSKDARQDLDTILAIASPGSDPILKTIAHLRNTATWHYAGPKNARWIRKALGEAADHVGSFRFGATMGTIRADFADEVFLQFAVQQFPGDDDAKLAALRLVYQRVGALITAGIRTAYEVLVAFFQDRREAIDFG